MQAMDGWAGASPELGVGCVLGRVDGICDWGAGVL